jgi:hypothetical protein
MNEGVDRAANETAMKDLIHHEFTTGFPDGWEDRTEVILVGPMRDGRRPTLTVARITLKSPQTLAQFAAFQRHGLSELSGVKDTDIVEEGETTLAGVEAYTRVYHTRFIDRMLTQRQVYAIRGQTAYVITETSAKEHYADDRPTFEEIMKRFHFRLPAP